eukprot:scaffold576456_cov24-Prasinocladus_malaysianus.AAC.1
MPPPALIISTENCHRQERCNVDGASYLLFKEAGSKELQIYQVETGRRDSKPERYDHTRQEQRGSSHANRSESSSAFSHAAMDRSRFFSFPMAMLCYRMAYKLLSAGEVNDTWLERIASWGHGLAQIK